MKQYTIRHSDTSHLDMPHPRPAIVVENLRKSYGTRNAVDGVSFTVQRGEVFALLGPNGAGKTTTVEILEGYRGPDSGKVRVLDLDPLNEGKKLRPQIGAMLQEGGLYLGISAREALHLFANFYAHPRSTSELLELVGLEDSANTRYRRLSGGQKQRLALALALIGRPELVFLDEPTAGLDPQARRSTWEIIARLKEEGVTVVLTTHYLEEAERLADRVAIMVSGKLVALGAPSDLATNTASTVRLRTATPITLNQLIVLPGVVGARENDGGSYLIETDDAPALLVALTGWLRDQNILATEIRVGSPSLEDVFFELAGEEARA